MKHPLLFLVESNGTLYASAKNSILAFRIADKTLVGLWTDPISTQGVQEEKFKNAKKVPTPGPGAPPVHNYIRSLALSRDGRHLVATTDSDKAAVVFAIDASKDNCLVLAKRQAFPKRPCAVATTTDDATLVVADKFGDVYATLLEKEEPVTQPILGHVSMLSDVAVAQHEGKQYIITGDRDEHVRVSNYPSAFNIHHWLFGHKEFVSNLHLCAYDPSILVTGGGDDYLLAWNWYTGEKLSQIDLRLHVAPYLTEAHYPPERFRTDESLQEVLLAQIVTLNDKTMLVLCENTRCLLVFKGFEHRQNVEVEEPIVAFAATKESVILSLDSGKLVELLLDGFKHVGSLDQIMENSPVEAGSETHALYTIHSLRKRSEH